MSACAVIGAGADSTSRVYSLPARPVRSERGRRWTPSLSVTSLTRRQATGVAPRHGADAHRDQSMQMFRTSPDNRVRDRPDKVVAGSGERTCSTARFTRTMTAPVRGPGGKQEAPAGKPFEVDFCTPARGATARSRRRTCL